MTAATNWRFGRRLESRPVSNSSTKTAAARAYAYVSDHKENSGRVVAAPSLSILRSASL